MSKSLKNFITIQQALEAHSPQELRLMFLLQPWDKPMTYSDQTVGDATAKLQTFRNFFGTVKVRVRVRVRGVRVRVRGVRVRGVRVVRVLCVCVPVVYGCYASTYTRRKQHLNKTLIAP